MDCAGSRYTLHAMNQMARGETAFIILKTSLVNSKQA